MFYRIELNTRVGYHLFQDSADWVRSKEKAIEEDVLFQGDANYSGSIPGGISMVKGGGLPFIAIEALFGINFKQAPLLKKIQSLHSFRGFRMGGGMLLYPPFTRPVYSYEGPVVYTLANPPSGRPSEYSYQGKIQIQDDFFILDNFMSFYYYHEKGISNPNFKPYVGMEVGLVFLSGKRKLAFETSDLTVSGSPTYTSKLEANIQENFFDELALRLGFAAGLQIHLYGAHFLDIRGGYYLQNSSIDLVRRGNWSEYRSGSNPDANYTKDVSEYSRSVQWDQSGMFVTLGYTVGLK
ncbi:MAG: hypothetical protein D6767_00810 [Candidatus Hydrogenedentota bacterium]|nr:MAG: hypothetical protein D6767_00810 [Candidatus Hydrogenedentota bacterium]